MGSRGGRGLDSTPRAFEAGDPFCAALRLGFDRIGAACAAKRRHLFFATTSTRLHHNSA